jgi:hypothetical protein
LWTEDGELRYLDAFDDEAYSEVADLVCEITGDPPRSSARAEKLQGVFGAAACDKSVRGFSFEMRRLPRCPNCGQSFLVFERYVDPVTIVDVPVSAVSHRTWKGLSLPERRSTVASFLSASGDYL